MNPFDLTGRVALVTGGGRGIGRSIARTLANAGADVGIAEFDPSTGRDAAKEMTLLGRKAHFVETDVRDSLSVDQMVNEMIGHFGKIDICINNAGIADHQPAETTSDEDWLNMMAVNVNGVFWCCRAIAKHMIPRGSGAIVNLGSMSGIIANHPQRQTPYNVSKAAVIMMTKSLAAEWTTYGIRVNSISPGYIDTEMCDEGVSPAWKAFWRENTPMGRMGEAHEIAQAALYLASDASSFASGTNLVVDGGYTCW